MPDAKTSVSKLLRQYYRSIILLRDLTLGSDAEPSLPLS